MKAFANKGNICMLSENEIFFLKTLLKKETEASVHQNSLTDTYRHCKFTIRKLTRQMANIDNIQLFRNSCREPTKDNTLFMVYRAERLYSAKGDAEKIFKHVAQHMYDTEKFDEIVSNAHQMLLDATNDKFLKKRENLLKRLLSQVSNFLGSYGAFSDRFTFQQASIAEWLQNQLDQLKECQRLIAQTIDDIKSGVTTRKKEQEKENGASAMLNSSNAAIGVAPEESVEPSHLESMVNIPSSPANSNPRLNY